MARNKRAFNFADFDFAESAFDLFQNSIRSGMDYDANISNQFQAKVLTRPTKLTGDPRNISFVAATESKTETFAFMVRIQGNQSPHRFLPDPCSIEYTKTPEQRTRAFNSIQLHTKVLMTPDSDSPLPKIDDIINITLERGEFGSFKTDLAKQYVSIVSESKIPAGQEFGACQTLAQKFSESDIVNSLGNTPSYSGALVNTTRDGLKYFGQWNVGASPPGFWESFSKRFEAHVNKLYPELGLKQENLGATRDLAAAANASNPARASGSKHGASLAKDHYLHTKRYGKYTSYKNDNPGLAKDQKFVDAIIDFMEQPEQADLLWGGTFGGGAKSKGSPPTGRGITEFHHFEFKSEKMPALFEPYREQLAEIGIRPEQLTSTSALSTLYLKLL